MTLTAAQLFDLLQQATDTPENKVLYILTVICILMILDFLTGSLAAWRDNTFRSQVGINGILRKLASILVLACCIPIAPLVPAEAGVAALYVLYMGYLIMEFKSILENLSKLGISITPLEAFLERTSQNHRKDNDQ